MAANLETLELTINGNAEKATQGIGHLIHSLGFLDIAVGKSVGGLKRLNAELGQLKRYGAIKLPDLSKVSATKRIKKQTDAIKEQTESIKELKQAQNAYDKSIPIKVVGEGKSWHEANPNAQSMKWPYTQESQEERHKADLAYREQRLRSLEISKQRNREFLEQGKSTKYYEEQTASLNEAAEATKKVAQETKEATQAITENKAATEQATKATEKSTAAKELESAKLEKVKAQTEKLNAETEKIKAQTEKVREATERNIGTLDKPINKVTKAGSNLLSTIGRIAKTMLIRTAIRALLNGAKQGLENFYNYSKKVGLEYSKTMDSIKSSWNTLKNQMGAALGTALAAVLPILNAIARGAIAAFNALTALFALLRGDSTYQQATADLDSYTNATTGAANATKDLIASFDELNVLSEAKGGAGGGVNTSDVTNMFQDVELPQWMTEWKPIIEAILAGVLGAIILPKIFEWVKKIFELFTGDKLDILKKFLKLFDDDTTFPEAPNYNDVNFPQQPNYSPFPVQPTYSAFPEAPDYSAVTAEMSLFAGAASLAAGSMDKIVEGITAIKAILEGFSTASTIIQGVVALFASLVGDKTVKFKIDSTEFKDFKEDFNKWAEENQNKKIYITIEFKELTMEDIGNWVEGEETKKITVEITANGKKEIESWVEKTDTKKIKVDISVLNNALENILLWAKTEDTKKINVNIQETGNDREEITNWINTASQKYIYLKFFDTNKVKESTDTWINTAGQKYIYLKFFDTNNVKGTTDEWINTAGQKYIYLNFVDNAQFIGWYTDWINKEDTKIVNLQFNNAVNENNTQQPSGNDNGTPWYQNIFEQLTNIPWDAFSLTDGWSVNQWINFFFGTDLPDGFASGVAQWIGENFQDIDPTEIQIQDLVRIDNDAEDWEELLGVFGGDLRATINSAIIGATGDEHAINMAEAVGLTGWDVLEEEAKKNLIAALGGLDSPDTIAKLKSELNVSASEIIQLSDWDSFSSDQRVKFLANLKNAYGSQEALKAAKDAGIDVAKAINEGLDSQDSEIQRIAKEMSDEFSTQKPEMDVQTDWSAGSEPSTMASKFNINTDKMNILTKWGTTPENLAKKISDQKPEMTATAAFDKAHDETELKDSITNVKDAVMSAQAAWTAKQDEQALKASITGVTDAVMSAQAAWRTGEGAVDPTTLKNEINNMPDAVMKAQAAWATGEGGVTARDSLVNDINSIVGTAQSNLTLTNTAATDLNTEIGDLKLKNKPVVVKPNTKGFANKVKNIKTENDVNIELTGKEKSSFQSEVNKIKTENTPDLKAENATTFNSELDSQGYSVSVKTKAEQTALNRMKQEIEGINATVLADLKAKGTDSQVIVSFSDAMKAAINKMRGTILSGGGNPLGDFHLQTRAMGGLVRSGDMFIANEDGTPELIAKFGNQSAVANTEQMVEAMARGVEYANESQNALLAEQNSLLRAILNKDSSVRLGASAALGRIARQSLDMYGAAMGV